MKYSIVVISKGRHHLLVQCVWKIKELKANPQIIVVEAIDKPEPFEIPGVIYLHIPVRDSGFAYQRNLGVDRAEGDFIIFADDDIEITDGWFEQLTRAVEENPHIAGAMGAVFPLKPSMVGFCEGVMGVPGGGFRLHYRACDKLLPINQIATCNAIMKRRIIQEIGGFDIRNKYGSEDTDISIRISNRYGRHQFRYVPRALVYHMPRNRIFSILPWYIRRGKADAGLFLKNSINFRYMVKTSLFVRAIPIAIAAILVQSWFIFVVGFFLWYLMQLYLARFMRSYFSYYHFSPIKRLIIFLLFPFVKFSADVMFEFGRVFRLCGEA